MDGILSYMKPKFISLAIGNSRLGSTTCHPHSKRLRVMITATTTFQSRTSLDHRRAAKLSTPNNKSVIEHTQSLKVLY